MHKGLQSEDNLNCRNKPTETCHPFSPFGMPVKMHVPLFIRINFCSGAVASSARTSIRFISLGVFDLLNLSLVFIVGGSLIIQQGCRVFASRLHLPNPFLKCCYLLILVESGCLQLIFLTMSSSCRKFSICCTCSWNLDMAHKYQST